MTGRVRVQDYEEAGADAAAADGGRRGIQSARDPRHWAGCEPVTIPANAEVSLSIQPNMDMNPDQLVIPNAFAPLVAVSGAQIGPISISAGDGPFPGEGFTADSTLRFLPAVPVTSGQPFRVRIRNLTSSPITGFFCGIVGKVKRQA